MNARSLSRWMRTLVVVYIILQTCLVVHGRTSKSRTRHSRQIQPLECRVPGMDDIGTCMFVYHCNQANGTHLGVCRDRFYIGTCCKLPDDTEDNHGTGSDQDTHISNELDGNVKPTSAGGQNSSSGHPTTASNNENDPFTTHSTSTSTHKPAALDRSKYPDSAFFTPNGTLLISDPKLICGRRFFPASRIVGGADATYGKWPWQISIRTWQNQARTHVHSCGAALLTANWAVTAAHCVEKVLSSEIIVRLGEFDLSDDSFPYGYIERRVQLIITHPNFSGAKRSFENDLALLRFYEPVTFQPNIVPICLPEGDEDFVGKTGWVTGWGRVYEGGPIPTRLNEVQVPIIDNQECERMFLEAGYHEAIPRIFLCAGWAQGGKDSCEGDSGGGIYVNRDNYYVLAGIISWGLGCARIGHPGVYTNIKEYINWINVVTEF